jgi:hypothetical protein
MRKKKNGERFSFADEPMPIKQPQPYKDDAPQLLLNWLLKWRKQTIKMNEILVYGPRPVRKRETALNSTQKLVEQGWLEPLPTRRPNMLEWQIARRPIVSPIIAM